MRTFNKLTIITWFLLCSNVAFSQYSLQDSIDFKGKEVFVLGTMHFSQHDFQKYPQNINREIERIIKYNPEMVCVEWINKSEELDLYYRDYSKLINHLEVELGINKKIAISRTDSLYSLLKKHPGKLRYRAELANYLYITRDYINACYQWYIIENSGLDSTGMAQFIPVQIDLYKKKLFYKRKGRLKHHEIIEIAFPVAWKLGHKKVYSIDYMHERDEYGKYVTAFGKRLEQELNHDPFEPIHKSFIDFTNNWLEKNKTNEKSSYFRFLNSDEYMNRLTDYYYSLYFRLGSDVNYSKWHELQIEKRNWKMFELLLNSIRETNSQRIYVIVGTTHKLFLERYLRESKYFNVWNYEQVEAL